MATRPLDPAGVGSLVARRRLGEGMGTGIRVAVTAATLGVVTMLTRLPLAGRYLFNWDALQFALGIQRFDLAAHRPHPPGYVGYVALGRLGAVLTGGDVNAALVLLSIVAQALTVAGLYLAARRLLGEFAAVAAAVLLLTSPLFWFYGETALTYGLEPGLSLLGFWLAWRAVEADGRGLPTAAAVIGITGAIRPSTEVFLVPMLAVAAWLILRRSPPYARRQVVLAALALVAASLAWVLPLVQLSGGPLAYLETTLQLGSRVSDGSAIWSAGLPGVLVNVEAVLGGAADTLGIFVALAVAAALVGRIPGVRRVPGPPDNRLRREHLVLAAAWALPALVVYSFVHIGQLAYVLFGAPAALLFAGPILDRLARALTDGRPHLRLRARAALLAGCAAANVIVFLAPHSLGAEAGDRDRHVQALLAEVRGHDPGSTLLLADPEGPGSYRLAEYYLPAYAAVAVGLDSHGRAGELFANHGGAPEYDLRRFNDVGPLNLPAMAHALVLDRQVVDSIGDRSRLREVKLDAARGDSVFIADLDPADPPVAWRDQLFLRGADCPCVGWAPPPARPILAAL